MTKEVHYGAANFPLVKIQQAEQAARRRLEVARRACDAKIETTRAEAKRAISAAAQKGKEEAQALYQNDSLPAEGRAGEES